MVITAPFLINQIAKEAPTLQYGIVPVPKGTTSSTYAVTDSVVMFKDSKVKPAAWKFLDFLFTKDPRVAFTKGEGFLPTTKAEATDPYFTDNARLKTFVDLLPSSAHFAPTVTGWADTSKAVTDAVQSVYIGQAQPGGGAEAGGGHPRRPIAGEVKPGGPGVSAATAPAARRVRIPLTPWLLILPSLVLALLIIGYPTYRRSCCCRCRTCRDSG